jgi:hypothetical protein
MDDMISIHAAKTHLSQIIAAILGYLGMRWRLSPTMNISKRRVRLAPRTS